MLYIIFCVRFKVRNLENYSFQNIFVDVLLDNTALHWEAMVDISESKLEGVLLNNLNSP